MSAAAACPAHNRRQKYCTFLRAPQEARSAAPSGGSM